MSKLLLANFKRIFISKWYILSILGNLLMSYIGSHKYFKDGTVYGLAYIAELMINLDMYKKVIVFFSSLSCVTVFCQDYNSRYINSILPRTKKKYYTISNIIITTLAGFTSVFIGMILFFISISHRIPVQAYETYGPYRDLCSDNPYIYIIVIASIFSLYSAMWTAYGLAVSVIIPDKCIALGTPVILGYLGEEITYRFPTPVNLYRLSHPGSEIFGDTAVSNYIYTLIFFLMSIIMAGYLFSCFVKRRVQDEEF